MNTSIEKDIKLYVDCLNQAEIIISNPALFESWNNITDIEVLAEVLYNLKKEKDEQSLITDQYIEYDDEIISIEECDDVELMDITVSGDNLFYANDILTKNSHGISMTADCIFALMSTPELEALGHMRMKQLKNRFGDLFKPNSWLIGVEKSHMRVFDVDLPNKLTPQSDPKEYIDNLSDEDVLSNKFKPKDNKKGMKF